MLEIAGRIQKNILEKSSSVTIHDRVIILSKLPFDMMPEVFNWIKVRRLSRSLHYSETMVFEPI